MLPSAMLKAEAKIIKGTMSDSETLPMEHKVGWRTEQNCGTHVTFSRRVQ